MAFGGQAWSVFWDPVQYTRGLCLSVSFFFCHLLSLTLLLVFLPYRLPFSPSHFSESLSTAWFFNLAFSFLIASAGLSSFLTPLYII